MASVTLLLSLAYSLADSDRPRHYRMALVFLARTGYGALIELGEAFVPGRTASLVDVLVGGYEVSAFDARFSTDLDVVVSPDDAEDFAESSTVLIRYCTKS